MRRGLASALVSAIVLASLAGSAPDALAGEGVGIGQRPTPTPGATVASGRPEVAVLRDGGGATLATYRAPRRGGSGRGGPVWECGYYDVGPIGPLRPGINTTGGIVTPQEGVSYWLLCRADDQVVYQALVLWDPANPFAGLAAGGTTRPRRPTTAVAARDPTIRTSPPETAEQLVGVATWLWLDDPWAPRSAQATLGGVTATVTATAVDVTWDPGDGSPTIVCADAGTAFDPSAPGRVSSCTHTYLRRSTGSNEPGAFPVSATVRYDVTWTATNGDGGDLDPLARARPPSRSSSATPRRSSGSRRAPTHRCAERTGCPGGQPAVDAVEQVEADLLDLGLRLATGIAGWPSFGCSP